MRILCFALFLALPAAAQWLHLPTAGVPRKADGSPNLEAATPRTADRKPDFSGMWIARAVLPCDSKERGVQCVELPLTPQVIDIAMGLKGGLPYQPWAAELVKRREKEDGINDPHTHCMPNSFPRAWSFPENQKILQMPGMLVVLHEFNASYRQIFFDGRNFPDDMTPAWSGYSVGRWEGDTLVVQSKGFRDDSWLDIKGNPLTDAAAVIERIRRPNYGSLEIEITVNDPKAYTKPWTITLHEKIVLDTEMMDLMCQENEKDVAHMVR
jgi:hypothetical protein